jgi:UDP:flavonoid glycosyltransferase YjiC (YdhE family)
MVSGMMKVLFTALPGMGHVHPLVPLAQALVRAGHEVTFALPRSSCAWVEAAGVPVVPLGIDWDGVLQVYPDLEVRLRDPRWLLNAVLAGLLPQRAVPELLAFMERWRPDVLVREASEFGAYIAAELTGIPDATVEIGAGSRQHRLVWLSEGLAATRAAFGLPPDPEFAGLERYLGLAFYPPSLDVPEGVLVPTRHYLQTLIFDRSGLERLPAWVGQLSERPIVYATLGTVWNRWNRTADVFAGVFTAILEGLRDEPINLVVTVGRNGDPAAFGPQPPNVHIERYIPQSLFLPHCHAVVAHAGRGTVLGALKHGVPLVLLPQFADQPTNAAICAALGVGRVVPPDALASQAIREATRAVLDDSTFRQRAQQVRAEMETLPGPEHAVALVERLAAEKRPIQRSDPCVN